MAIGKHRYGEVIKPLVCIKKVVSVFKKQLVIKKVYLILTFHASNIYAIATPYIK